MIFLHHCIRCHRKLNKTMAFHNGNAVHYYFTLVLFYFMIQIKQEYDLAMQQYDEERQILIGQLKESNMKCQVADLQVNDLKEKLEQLKGDLIYKVSLKQVGTDLIHSIVDLHIYILVGDFEQAFI